MSSSNYSLKQTLTSSVGKKYIMALTGLALTGFTLSHLIGNLLILVPDDGVMFNIYAKKLYDLGALLKVAEIGLILAFLAHVAAGIQTKLSSKQARENPYYVGQKSKEGPSKSNLSSKNMIIAGAALFAFIIFHLWHFKYGPSIEDGYITYVKGETSRDIFLLVIQEFKKPWVVLAYVFSMIMLGFHLRHGFWSAFQSLGIAFPRVSKPIYLAGVLIAVVLSFGFIAIPLRIFFGEF